MFKMPTAIYAGGAPIKALRVVSKKLFCRNLLSCT